MATRKIVPRATGEGGIGKATKRWGDSYLGNVDAISVNIAEGETYNINGSPHTHEIPEGSLTKHGVESIGTIAFNNSTHVLSVSAITYWYKSVETILSSSVECDLDLTADRDHVSATLTTNTLYYVYFKDSTGKLYWSPSMWNLYEMVPIATVFWNGSEGAVCPEAHGHKRDIAWHIWAHTSIGCRYITGLDKTYPTAASDAVLQIESGSLLDEDKTVSIGQQTTMRGWYKISAGTYTFANYSLPYLGTLGAPVYLDTDTYSLTTFASNKYICYWVFGTNDQDRSIAIIPSHAANAYTLIADARSEVAPAISGVNPEWKLLYRWIYTGDGQFQESSDYRLQTSVAGGVSAATNASAVSFNPSGNIVATNVQTAIEELDAEKTSYTDAAARSAVIASSISDGDTTHAPDGNSVFDALALKAPLISPSFTTPALGTPSSGTLTNCTGLPQAGVTGLTTTDSPVFGTVKLSGLTDGYLPKHTSDAVGLVNSPIYTDGTNVGIGTLTPTATLDIRSFGSPTSILNGCYIKSNWSNFNGEPNVNNRNIISSLVYTGTGLYPTGWQGSVDATVDMSMTLTNNQTISGPIWSGNFSVSLWGTNGSYTPTITSLYGVRSGVNIVNSGWAVSDWRAFEASAVNGGNGTITNAYGYRCNALVGTNKWAFYAVQDKSYFGAEVGIGTTSPASKLSVAGNLSVGANYAAIAAPTNGAIFEGNVGIGTSSPNTKLEVSGGPTVYSVSSISLSGGDQTSSISKIAKISAFYSSAGWENRHLRIAIGPNGALEPVDAIALNSYLNVGIGTVTQASKLSVAGNLSIGANYAAIAAPTNGAIFEGNVGIGTNSLNAKLEVLSGTSGTYSLYSGKEVVVAGPDYILTSGTPNVQINSTSTAGVDNGGSIGFGGKLTSSDVRNLPFAVIKGAQESTGNGYLVIGTHINSVGITEKLRITSAGLFGIMTPSPTAVLDINSNILRLRTAKTPASASAAGNAGDICWSSDAVYVCVATNTWKRALLATW